MKLHSYIGYDPVQLAAAKWMKRAVFALLLAGSDCTFLWNIEGAVMLTPPLILGGTALNSGQAITFSQSWKNR